MRKLLPAMMLLSVAVLALAHSPTDGLTKAQALKLVQPIHEHPAPNASVSTLKPPSVKAAPSLAEEMRLSVEKPKAPKKKKPEVYTVTPAPGAKVLLRFKDRENRVIISFNTDGTLELGEAYVKSSDDAGRAFIDIITMIWGEQMKAACRVGIPTVRPGHVKTSRNP